jgi:hypothetical protein
MRALLKFTRIFYAWRQHRSSHISVVEHVERHVSWCGCSKAWLRRPPPARRPPANSRCHSLAASAMHSLAQSRISGCRKSRACFWGEDFVRWEDGLAPLVVAQMLKCSGGSAGAPAASGHVPPRSAENETLRFVKACYERPPSRRRCKKQPINEQLESENNVPEPMVIANTN